jgi:hypothetical protein
MDGESMITESNDVTNDKNRMSRNAKNALAEKSLGKEEKIKFSFELMVYESKRKRKLFFSAMER